jgi:hypothetical protein
MRAEYCLFRGALTFSVLFFPLPAVCRAQFVPSVGTATHGGFTDPRSQEADRFKLSPLALQAAQIIGVEPLITRLSSLAAAKDITAGPGMSLEELSLRQQITEAVVVASLDVDDVLDRIDYERAQVIELRDILRSNRDRAVGTTSVATLAIGTGLGVVSGVLQFSDSTQGAGNIIGFAAGGISTLLSFHSIRQQRKEARVGSPGYAIALFRRVTGPTRPLPEYHLGLPEQRSAGRSVASEQKRADTVRMAGGQPFRSSGFPAGQGKDCAAYGHQFSKQEAQH